MKKPKALGVGDRGDTPLLSVQSTVEKPKVKRQRETISVKTAVSAKTATKLPSKIVKTTKQKLPRRAAHRPVPTDVLGKSISIDTSETLNRKLEIVGNISSRSRETKSTYVHVGTPSLAEFKTRLHVALMSPFKAQVDHNLLASGIARYAGVALVIVGGMFTLYGMNALTTGGFHEGSNMVANTCASGTNCITTGTVSDPLFTSPQASIGINTSSVDLKGEIEATVTVTNATRVDLFAVQVDSGTPYLIRTLEKVSDTTWRGVWDTRRQDDGTYRLKAVIVNQYGSYSVSGSVDYLLVNTPLEIEHASSSPGSTVVATTTLSTEVSTAETTPPTTPTLNIKSDVQVTMDADEPLHGNVTLTTEVKDALSVKHFYKPMSGTGYTLMGGATYRGTSERWNYIFDTKRIPDGTYSFRTQVFFKNNETEVYTIDRVSVLNTVKTEVVNEAPLEKYVSTLEEPNVVVPFMPEIVIDLPVKGTLSNSLDVFVRAESTSFVELYLTRDGALTPRFLGLGIKQSDGVWKFRFDTTQVPNGNYTLFAKVRHTYGDTESDGVSVTILNDIQKVLDPSQKEIINTMTALGSEVKIGFTVIPKEESASPVSGEKSETDTNTADENSGDDTKSVEIEDTLMPEVRVLLTSRMNEYAKALRSENDPEARAVLEALERDQDTIVRTRIEEGVSEEEISRMKDEMRESATREREHIERSEKLIRERIGVARFDDSDSDGISNFDEINLYKTDAFSADSDQDGFTDGAEIGGGFNPLDDAREAYIAYESPKETGILREDILVVESITKIDEGEETKIARAHVSGRALPHSFVTLYIFSTPIVVTVKADQNGSWSYIFDKELDDGTHEVYAGMTDNAGRIIAKSNPFTFVKTAEAFSPIDADVEVIPARVEAAAPSLLSGSVALVIGSLAIVALGLVLILLGMQVRPTRNEFATVT